MLLSRVVRSWFMGLTTISGSEMMQGEQFVFLGQTGRPGRRHVFVAHPGTKGVFTDELVASGHLIHALPKVR